MKKLLSVAAAVSFASVVAGPLRADENVVERGAKATGEAIKSGAKATGEAIKSGAEATGDAIKGGAQATGEILGITDTDRERFEANRRDERRVTGTVSAIDHETGKLSLAAANTTYQLHFPPSALKEVAKGERLAVTMAFALPDEPLAEGAKHKPAAAGDAPMRAHHWMTGTVTDVNASTGTVGVKTDDALLTLRFSPEAVRDVQTGEKIAIALAFNELGTSAD